MPARRSPRRRPGSRGDGAGASVETLTLGPGGGHSGSRSCASPESINSMLSVSFTPYGYGFRVRGQEPAPRNDELLCHNTAPMRGWRPLRFPQNRENNREFLEFSSVSALSVGLWRPFALQFSLLNCTSVLIPQKCESVEFAMSFFRYSIARSRSRSEHWGRPQGSPLQYYLMYGRPLWLPPCGSPLMIDRLRGGPILSASLKHAPSAPAPRFARRTTQGHVSTRHCPARGLSYAP